MIINAMLVINARGQEVGDLGDRVDTKGLDIDRLGKAIHKVTLVRLQCLYPGTPAYVVHLLSVSQSSHSPSQASQWPLSDSLAEEEVVW